MLEYDYERMYDAFLGIDTKEEEWEEEGIPEEYSISKEDNIFYFFNPCSPEHFATILEHIILSVEEHSRVVTLILYYVSEEYLKIIREMCWKQKRMIRLPKYMEDTDEKIYVFQNPLY